MMIASVYQTGMCKINKVTGYKTGFVNCVQKWGNKTGRCDESAGYG